MLSLVQTSQNRRKELKRFLTSLNAQKGIDFKSIQLIFVDQGDNLDVFEEINVKVLKPSQWKYKEDCIVTERKGHNINKNLLAEKIVKVNAFKRKLPSGSKRSDNADMLSKKYCIDLNEDETIVSPFERKQKVKL